MVYQMTTLDLGSGNYPRGDIALDLHFQHPGTKKIDWKVGKANDKALRVKGDLHCIPFRARVFDTVLLIHALEHTLLPFIVLKEMKRVMKKRGIIVLPRQGDIAEDHIWLFNEITAARLISKVFEIKRIEILPRERAEGKEGDIYLEVEP